MKKLLLLSALFLFACNSDSEINENDFDLITIVHVLEHLNKPIENILKLKNILSKNGVIYAEVPNLYGLPMINEAHKISFSKYSYVNMFKSAGFEILDYGFTKSPKESIKFDYIYHYETENIFIVCGKLEKKLSLNLPKKEIPKNIESFKSELKYNYAKLMFKDISLTLFLPSLRYLKR